MSPPHTQPERKPWDPNHLWRDCFAIIAGAFLGTAMLLAFLAGLGYVACLAFAYAMCSGPHGCPC